MTRRGVVGTAAALLLLAAATGPIADGHSARAPVGAAQAPQHLLMRVGDTVRVDGADVGCQVTAREGEVTMECRRLTKPAGTYGTFIGDRHALVARYHATSTAQIVFTARHHGSWKACRKASASAAHLAAVRTWRNPSASAPARAGGRDAGNPRAPEGCR